MSLLVDAAESPAVRWLRGDASDRARFEDMAGRFRAASQVPVACAVAQLISAWWYGWLQVALLAVGALAIAVDQVVSARIGRPEVTMVGAFVVLLGADGVAVSTTGGADSALLPLLMAPVFAIAVCFRLAVVRGAFVLAALAAVPAVLMAPALPPEDRPPALLSVMVLLAVLISISSSAALLVRSDLGSRDEAVIDPMTGLRNRLSLSAHFTELQRRARVSGRPVGLIMVDVDHFKQINDTRGHAHGDQVLRELADRFRETLRPTDVAYRVGGEEFLVLLPDRDSAATEDVARRLHGAVAARPLGGLPVTVSVGVVSGGPDHVLAELLRVVDVALYTAKRAGRNRVEVATLPLRSPA